MSSSSLLRQLFRRLGPSAARAELAWLTNELPANAIHDALRRRADGEPLQYILGTQPFGPLNLLVRPPVLIPRPETEDWVLRLARTVTPTPQQPVSVLDLCTGTGCIPLLLCHLWPAGSAHAHGIDISPHALRLAQDNATVCGIQSHSDIDKPPQNTITFSIANILSESSLLDQPERFKSPFHILTSNPPYIPWHEFLRLPRSVAHHEDPRALFGGPTGLEFYQAIARLISRSPQLFASDALVALEVGHDQAPAVERILRQTTRFRETEIWKDPWGKQRTVIARM